MNDIMQALTGIMHRAAEAGSPGEQVNVIVDAISEALGTDVCSLYLENVAGDMALVASHGLAMHHPQVIPAGKGLVGRVVNTRHAINLKHPEKEPDYYHLAQSREERFHSFCGVPLVRRGHVVGVLVVQSRQAEVLDQEREAFLSTLASHLALIADGLKKVQGIPESGASTTLTGISGAPGLATGRALVVSSGRLDSVPDGRCKDPEQELQSWRDLRANVVGDLQRERDLVEQALGKSLATVLDAYSMLLQDPAFNARIESELRSGNNLPVAIRNSTRFFSEQFQKMDDPYLQARHEDIEQLGEKLYHTWLGGDRPRVEAEADPDEPCVLVGHSISVSDIAGLPSDRLQAIVCQSGAALSHIAVFANALGIPAVMGIGDIPHLTQGEWMIVDGAAGLVIRNPLDSLVQEYQVLIDNRREVDQQLAAMSDQPSETLDGVRIELLVNSGLQADIMPGLRRGAEGIGLYRTEIPFMARHSLPSEEEQVAVYRYVIQAYRDKPVCMRTLDIGGDKPLPYLPQVLEENPALGWRGIRFTLDNVQLLITQIRAIIRAAGGSKSVSLLFPMVCTTWEVDQCVKLVDDACRQLREEGLSITRPGLGVMLEIPGAVSLLPFWAEKLDFISIGSNDLSQYLLAIDRNNPVVGKLYDPLHPAVVHEIHRIVLEAGRLGLPVSVCGEMASDPVAVAILVGLGIRRLSMSSARLPLIRHLVRSLTLPAAESLAREILTLDSAAGIRRAGLALLDELDDPRLLERSGSQ